MPWAPWVAALLLAVWALTAPDPLQGRKDQEDAQKDQATATVYSTPAPDGDQYSAADPNSSHEGPIGSFRLWVRGLLVRPESLFNLILAASTIALWRETKRLAQGAEDQAEHIEASANAAVDTVEIAKKQLAIIGAQTDIIEKQKEIARLQFFAEHRPRLVLKDVYVDPNNCLVYELANIGGSETSVLRGFVALASVTDPIHFKWPLDAMILAPLNGMRFGAGEFKPVTQVLRDDTRELIAEGEFYRRFPDAERIGNLDNPRPPLGVLFFFGALEYVDGRGADIGITRLSVFRRWLDRGTGVFMRTGNPDHEYSD